MRFLLILLVLFSLTGISAGKSKDQPFPELLQEISRYISTNSRLSKTGMEKALSDLQEFRQRKIAIIKSNDFDGTYPQLLQLSDRFDAFVDTISANPPASSVILGFSEAFFDLFEYLGKWHQTAFDELKWENQFQNMLPHTQSRNVYHDLQTNVIFLVSLALAQCDEPVVCKQCRETLKKQIAELDFERFARKKHVNQEILRRKLERILQAIKIILEQDYHETDPVVRKNNAEFVNTLRAHQQTLRVELESVADSPRALNVESAVVWFNCGNDAGEPTEKIRCYSQAIRLDTELVAAYKNRGNVYQQLGLDSLAIPDYSEVIRLDPGYALAYTYRGISYNNGSKFSLALADFEQALQFNPEHPQTLNGKGTALRNLGQTEAAISAFQLAVESDPTYTPAFQNLGLCCTQAKKYPQAIAAYRRAIELAPATASNYYNLGCIYWALNRWPEVIRNWEKCLELEPDHPQVNQWIAKARREAQY